VLFKSGVPNAIKAFKKHGITKCGVRIDSGDVAYLSRKVRKMMDEAGLTDCKIIVSNSLDEHIIRDLIQQGAKIDAFGVGERLITSRSSPVFGGVYKLCAVEKENGEIIPKIKISENIEKITNPHFKKLYRLFDNETGKAIADLICLHHETIDDSKPLTIFDPHFTWKKKTITNFTAKELLEPVFVKGKCVYPRYQVAEIREFCRKQVDTLWDEVKRLDNPHRYYVDLSEELWNLKQKLLSEKA